MTDPRAVTMRFFVRLKAHSSSTGRTGTLSSSIASGRAKTKPLANPWKSRCAGSAASITTSVENRNGKLREADRDPSHPEFGVDYYVPTDSGDEFLCRRCGALSKPDCGCAASSRIRVKKCKSHHQRPDQLKQCETCGYQRSGIGDPVQEIVHGSDGPNTVIATALHELLPDDRRKILAFADSRQEAAFFAWYAENSYKKLRDRNLILRAIRSEQVAEEGLSIDDLRNRLLALWEKASLFSEADTREQKTRQVLTSILHEAVTDEKRLSLSGVGLVKWFVALPRGLRLPDTMRREPWNFTEDQERSLVGYLLDEMRPRRAVNIPEGAETPNWNDVSPWPQQAFCIAPRGRRRNVSQWGSPQSAIVKHFLYRLLADSSLSEEEKQAVSVDLMKDVWRALRDYAPSRYFRVHRPTVHSVWILAGFGSSPPDLTSYGSATPAQRSAATTFEAFAHETVAPASCHLAVWSALKETTIEYSTRVPDCLRS